MRALGDQVRMEDEACYLPLAAWWADVQGGCRRLIATSLQTNYRLHTDTLADAIRRLAAFAGCGVTLHISAVLGESGGAVTCYAPELVEACLLFLLSEVRERAATRSATVELETVNGEWGGGLRLTLRYSVLHEDSACAPTQTDGFFHVAQVAELCGLDLYCTFSDSHPSEAGERERLCDCTVTLEWMRDPTLMPTSDLKSRLRIAYGN